jgi:hypothetical protein
MEYEVPAWLESLTPPFSPQQIRFLHVWKHDLKFANKIQGLNALLCLTINLKISHSFPTFMKLIGNGDSHSLCLGF